MKRSQRVRVKNCLGLHARPASIIARLLQKSKSKVLFTCGNDTIDARSIFGVLMLAAGQNAEILIDVEGEDADTTLMKLVHAFDTEFGEGEIGSESKS